MKTALYRTEKPAPKFVDEPLSHNADVQHTRKAIALYCVDLFAGCGGLSLGLEKAGFKPLLFSELNKSAAETYVANRVGQGIIPWGDIYNLTDENPELLKVHWRYLGITEINLVFGGPPFQGYSGIGDRRSFQLEKKDIPSNHLYQEMAGAIRMTEIKAAAA